MGYKLPHLFLRNVLALGAGAFFIVLASGLFTVKQTTSQDRAISVKPSVFEVGEDLPGGKATSKKSFNNRNAFSHSSGDFGFEKDFRYASGVVPLLSENLKKAYISALQYGPTPLRSSSYSP